MKIPVIWLSFKDDVPGRGYWDQGLIEDLISNHLWNPVDGYEFLNFNTLKDYYDDRGPRRPGAVVVFPARSQVDEVLSLNQIIKDFNWVVLLLTGDEESTFPIEKIKHKNIIIYVMSPKEAIQESKYRTLGSGYPPQINKYKSSNPPDKDINWFFSGQVTHQKRVECVEKLRDLKHGMLVETEGFTQGLSHELYYENMANSKIVPCPSGPKTPDTFRLFEALEMACVPIVDTSTSENKFTNLYWRFFFREDPPFPVLKTYEQLPGYIEDTLKLYPSINNDVFSWWIRKKRELSYQFNNDIHSLSKANHRPELEGPTLLRDLITVIIPVSPIKSHPDIKILDETIKSVRYHLPDSEIILTFDGVRPEQIKLNDKYHEFTRRVLWKCNVEYKNVVPLIFKDHSHQVLMAKEALNYVKTPTIVYVEQDAPLTRDEIPFKELIECISSGVSNVVRLHHEAVIPKDHEKLIHGMEPNQLVPLMRTSQWSQRPHIASTSFYKMILSHYFTDNAKSFIEDKMHGVVHEAYIIDGEMGWYHYRLHIYAPPDNMKRSYHTDGREGEQKYDDSQVF